MKKRKVKYPLYIQETNFHVYVYPAAQANDLPSQKCHHQLSLQIEAIMVINTLICINNGDIGGRDEVKSE